ncbi:MAG: hypothetical protein BGO10_01440 [Chlamydia sp. 32-24]|nr:MAG: hypothetical protein BGO10_01440 [Chlamydia sp. 32-24]
MADQTTKKALQTSETPKTRKDTAIVTSDRYKTPKTSPLIFHFEPASFASPDLRLQECVIEHTSIEGKDVYLFDDFFLDEEAQELRDFSTKSEFSRTIFAEHYSRTQGEEPARAMDNKEKWRFFANPPQSVKEIYKLLNFIAYRLDADVTTLPWELYDQDICAPAVATNRIENLSHESMELGKHEDYSPESGIPFGIPILYSKDSALHSNQFINGDPGKPWLVSLMLYSTSEDFLPEYGMGTIFCKKNGEIALRGACKHMRFVLFEGDIIHSIEESKIPSGIKPWRVSYVFKLVINPKNENQSMKKVFYELMRSYKLLNS